jgi:Cu+-exporting ATPase
MRWTSTGGLGGVSHTRKTEEPARGDAILRCNRWKGPASSNREAVVEKDVVCGMQVDRAKAAATSEYNGKTYYFCAKACKTKFDANPSQYVK